MASLAELANLVGFFSYSRRDDEHSGGALSRLRARIHDELRMQLGRDLRLWQDTAAIPHGTQWADEINAAIAESAFFIPIVTPSAVASEHCQLEFRAFVEREGVLGRADLVFPILYIRVPALLDDAKVRENAVLEMVHSRQYADWTKIRLQEVGAFEVARQVERLCQDIVTALERPWTAPKKRPERPPLEVLGAPPDRDGSVAPVAAPATLGAEPVERAPEPTGQDPGRSDRSQDHAQAGTDVRPDGEARAAKERAETERAETERAETERAAKEQAAGQQAERERAEKEIAGKKQAETERAETERAETERAETERAERERAERLRADTERAEQLHAFALARRAKTVLGIDVFLAAYPDSHLVGEAVALRTALEASDRAYAVAVAKGDRAALDAFVKTHPAALQADDVRQRLRKVDKRRLLVASLAALGVVTAVGIGVGVSWFALRVDDLAMCAKADGGDAMAACTRVIQDSGASPGNRAIAYSSRGAIYGSQRKYDQAVADFTQALKLDPNSATAYLKRSSMYEADGEHDKAIADLNDAIRLDAKNAQAYELRGDAYGNQRKYDEAIADYTRALGLVPGSASVHRKRGGAYEAKKDNDRALADLDEAIRLDSKNADAYALRAEANFNLKKYDQAIADADRALKLDPKSAVARANRGKAYQAKGNNDQAIIELTQAIRDADSAPASGQVWTTASVPANSRQAEAFIYRGHAYKAKNDNDSAIADYTQAAQLDPNNPLPVAYRAYAYTAKDQYDRAIADWTRLITVAPQNGFLYYQRGTNYVLSKDYDRAIADFNIVIRLDPDDAKAYFGRGLAKQSKGDNAGAIVDFTAAIERKPEPNVYYYRAQARQSTENYAAAITDYSEVIRRDPRNGSAFRGRGASYLLTNDYNHALADFNAAIGIDPKDAYAYLGRGLTKRKKGDNEGGNADIATARRLDPSIGG